MHIYDKSSFKHCTFAIPYSQTDRGRIYICIINNEFAKKAYYRFVLFFQDRVDTHMEQ